MKIQQESIQILQKILEGTMNGSHQHFIHATINRQKGFIKIADKMTEEYNEEVADAGRIINRILELGGTPILEPAKLEIYLDVQSQLIQECREQFEGLEELQNMYDSIANDVPTRTLLQEYIINETEHAAWLKQQVALMDAVGVQNFLAAQI